MRKMSIKQVLNLTFSSDPVDLDDFTMVIRANFMTEKSQIDHD